METFVTINEAKLSRKGRTSALGALLHVTKKMTQPRQENVQIGEANVTQ